MKKPQRKKVTNLMHLSKKCMLIINIFFFMVTSEGHVHIQNEYVPLSNYSKDEHNSDLTGFDQAQWSGETEQQTLIPYSKLFYTYIFEPVIEKKEDRRKFQSSIINMFLNKTTFAICLLVWSCILFIACGTVADTYISSLMIKLAECLNLSDTFAGSTLLAFSNAASDVILGIISVSIGEKDAIDVFLGDVIGACLFIILVVFGFVMVFSKNSVDNSYIYIPVFNHLRDTMALTVSLIQLLIINHMGYISPKMSFVPLIGYGCYVLLLQWSEKSTSMPLCITIRDEYFGPVYEHVIDSKEGNNSSKFSLRNSNTTDARSALLNTLQMPSVPFTPPGSFDTNKINNLEKFEVNTNDPEIPSIKLSFLSSSEDYRGKAFSGERMFNKELYWDRIGSKSRSIKKTLLLLTPTHSPSLSLANEDIDGKITTPKLSNSLHSDSRRLDSTLLQDSSEKGTLVPGKADNITKGQKRRFQREKVFSNTLEPPQYNVYRSKSPSPFGGNSRYMTPSGSSCISVTVNSPAEDKCVATCNSFKDGTINGSNRSNSHSELVLVSDDYAIRLSRNLSMSEMVYQTESLYNSLLPPPAHRENVMKLQKRGRIIKRENRTRHIPGANQSFSYIQINGDHNIENSNNSNSEENQSHEYGSRLHYWLNFEILRDDLFGFLNFVRQLLMTPIMFILYLTVPSPSLRNSVQIMQPLFIVLIVGFEKKIYKNYPLLYLLALLSSSILSLILFVIYTFIIPPDDQGSENYTDESGEQSQSLIANNVCSLNLNQNQAQRPDANINASYSSTVQIPSFSAFNTPSSGCEDNYDKQTQRFDTRASKYNKSKSCSPIKFVDVNITSSKRQVIKDFLMYCNMLFGIFMSIYWNGVLVNELVECIRVIGLTLGIKPAILGLTIVAMGNSIADLFANVAVSKAGHAHMGLAGCYGACVFLLLFGFGSSIFVRTVQLGFSKDIHLHFESQIVTATYQLLYFLPFSALIVVISKGRVHKVWGLLFIVYFALGMIFILNGAI